MEDPFIKSVAKNRVCGGFITRHCYVHDGQWRSDISIQHLQFTDNSWSYVSNGPICSKSNPIHGLPFRNSRLGLGRCNGRTSRRQKQAGSFGETAKRNSLRIRPRTVGSKPAARRYGKGCEDIAGSAIARPSLISNAPAAVAVSTAIRNRKRRGRSPHSGSIPRKLSVLIDADKREHRNRRPSRCSLP